MSSCAYFDQKKINIIRHICHMNLLKLPKIEPSIMVKILLYVLTLIFVLAADTI